MKKTLSFLPFLLFNTFLRSSSTQQPTPVLDIDGKPLRTDSHYYILPVLPGHGGGLTLGSADNENCPLYVVQEQSEIQPGLSLTLTPIEPSNGVVYVHTDLNVKFDVPSICNQSNVWKVHWDVAGISQYIITSDGVEGDPGIFTLYNWFKIEKYDDRNFKLVYCPTLHIAREVMCNDIGIFIHNGRRFLFLSYHTQFSVMFKKA